MNKSEGIAVEEQGMILEDFYIAVKKRWIMILVLILVPILIVLFKPKGIIIQEYEASTKLYVIRTDLETIADSPKGSIEYNLLNSFVESLKTNKTIEEALENANSTLTIEEVSSKIYAGIFQDSNVVDLSLSGTDEREIIRILDEIVKIAEKTVTNYIPNSEMSAIDTITASEVSSINSGDNVKKLILIFGAMTFIALLLAVTLEYLDDSFKHEDQIEKTLKEPVLAIFSKKNKNNKIIYNKIVTNILYNHKDMNNILISATTNNEGKDEFVEEVARAIAEKGNNILVIDVDRGLSENNEIKKIMEVEDVNKLIIKKEYDLLSINNDSLSEDNIKKLFISLDGKYQYILINGTPINNGVLSQCFAKEVDGTIYIVKGYKNKRKVVLRSINELKAYNSNIIGIVLNNIEA
ncbi:hypothetical protein [uncultured Clostridium sp.]|uniref:hypothetical protein n=1 Tax=uncultured Clostridium sp. TaxID=59620 RepID=UPI0025ED5438|nr:hypothetical protein [uncultured Clostridium sp.]MDU4884561.1 hypothetical protein [Clostridium celatum]MDU7077731.1 hypothetical protein [Clostridium celatum]